jgi:nitroimidazol reductase NimA-like FMN-containing flavoprotein (pyridoxamine 5'-phosphate oxidase superfamily)
MAGTNKGEIRERLKTLFQAQTLAVVATSNQGQPYTSLVAFIATADLQHIYFVTPRATRKFANIRSDARVSVLINSSENRDDDFHRAVSVTAVGDAHIVSEEDRAAILADYLAKHPFLEDFAVSPSCAIIRVTVRSYYLVRNFQQVMELHIHP